MALDESWLLRGALITTIIGLAALAIIVSQVKNPELNIGDAKSVGEGGAVKVQGTVTKIMAKDGFSVLTISKKEDVDIVVFDKLNLTKGMTVSVEGKTKDYNGKTEIVGDIINVVGK